MKKIVLEEHFVLNKDAHIDRWHDTAADMPTAVLESILPELIDVGARRLDTMDAAQIDMMVLSNTGVVQGDLDPTPALALAREANDYLAETIHENPERFAGFATVPLQDPRAGADELERAVTDLELKGTMIFGQTNGVYLDDRRYDVFWERVQALGCPVYLHAADPQVAPASYTDANALMGPIWSWAAETSTHLLRLVFNGVLDRYPDVRVIAGHMGETLPYLMWRLDRRSAAQHLRPNLPPPSDLLRRNLWVTSAGVFSEDALKCAQASLGADHVMFSVDYPFEDLRNGSAWLDSLELPEHTQRQFSHTIAQDILGL